jgi:NodT family efflux transporter outer membrane factor (OMF) lipoprotein
MKKQMLRTAAAIALCGAVSGCGLDGWIQNGFKVGPQYTTPSAPISSQWIDYRKGDGEPEQPVDLAEWWGVFNDPVLNNLMHDAHKQNLSLRQAAERIEQARAGRDLAIGNLFPQTQNVAGSHTVNKLSDREVPGVGNEYFQNVNGGFNVGWELDFWGRFRRAVEASDATLEASIEDFDDVMVVLLADVARNYVQYRTFQERLFLARQNAEIQKQAFELAENNFKAGATTERDMQQAKQVYEQTNSLIPGLEAGVRITNNRICVLLGIPVQDLSPRLGETGKIPSAPVETAMGIPADLLRRRPDVRRAERIAAAQSAQIGVAVSDLYPHFAINGSIGLSAEYIGGLWHTPGSMAGSFGPSFRWDILNYGRIESSIKGQEAKFREFMLGYQNAVLTANREAEDAVITFAKSREREAYLAKSVAAAKRTVQITYEQYRQGAVDFTPVFLFEGTLTEQQDAHAQAQGDIALSIVDLYRSLGGGWQSNDKPEGISGPPVPAPTTQRTPSRPAVFNTTQPAATQP